MVKLTADMIQQCAQYTNAINEREIDFRGYKISVIENLGATLDQFESMDMSDNEIKKIEGFPLLRRLKTLLLNNNRVCRVQENLEEFLPNIETLVLTNNSMNELADLDTLTTVKSLRMLSLMRNTVANKHNYRLYVIHKLPHLKVLDFQKIRLRERETAKRLFAGKRGEKLQKEISSKRPKTFELPPPLPPPSNMVKHPQQEQDLSAIRLAIANAQTLEEVQRLEQLLRKGQLPGKGVPVPEQNGKHEEEEEMDEM